MRGAIVCLLLSSCSELAASSISSTPGIAPIICYNTMRMEGMPLDEILALCGGAQTDPVVCYRAARNSGLNKTESAQLCKGA